jgi:hypothetical protein
MAELSRPLTTWEYFITGVLSYLAMAWAVAAIIACGIKALR